jgi:hypothetical protein
MNKNQFNEKVKKRYTKPDLARVSLRPEEAVLGNCKMSGSHGPASVGDCSFPAPCNSVGS